MTSDRNTLLVIAGPTGSGKTDLAVEVAMRLGAPVISADSRQVFKNMPVGTAQPSAQQLSAIKHYFIADREVSDDFNAGIFEREALELLDVLFADNEYVVMVGGSGLYIDAVCYGLDALPTADPRLRDELAVRLEREGLQSLAEELKRLDPLGYAAVDRNNPARVIRALEVCRQTGRPYSEQRIGVHKQRPFRIVKVAIDTPREELYERINMRVERMITDGLVAEAQKMYQYRHLNALQTVGYKELFDYFDGTVTLDHAVELIKRNSRRYAKRQMTWLRRDADIHWVTRRDADLVENLCRKNLQ